MQVTQESLFLTLTNGNTFASTFASFAASLLGVNVSYIEVMDLTLDPGTSITSTAQTSISVRGDFIVAPADSYSADMVSHEPVPACVSPLPNQVSDLSCMQMCNCGVYSMLLVSLRW